MGAYNERSHGFKADGAVTQHRVAIQGTADGDAKLPTTNDATGVLGIFRETRADNQHVSVLAEGREYIEAGGVCTRGSYARVLNTGTVVNVATNATPAQQTYVGVFLESATTGQLALVEIRPGQITQ